MVSKAVAGVDGWFIQPEAVLQDQRDQGTEPRPGRLFMSVDPDASDVELEHAAIAALDRIFGPVGVVPRSVLDPVGASSGGLIDPYGGPNEDDPDLFGPDPEVGPDEINGPWED